MSTPTNEWREALQRLVDEIDVLIGDPRTRAGVFFKLRLSEAKVLLARPDDGSYIERQPPKGYASWYDAAVDERVKRVAAEKAREPKLDDMAMLIRQLCSALNRFNPGGPTSIRAMQYLASHGLEGSVLRDLPSPPAATSKTERCPHHHCLHPDEKCTCPPAATGEAK